MSSTQKFHYQPFAKPRFIRVLTLCPSTSSTKPLECRLHQVSIDELKSPKAKYAYEALSYVWGARNGTVPIICDKQTLLITPNCESALRHLRHKFTRRVLWIDAICIDQQSVQEKNSQVSLMGEIYTRAQRVVIWLGPGQTRDEDLFRHARIGGRLYHVRGLPPDEILTSQRIRKWVSKLMTDEEIEAVRGICSNVWFTRIWTIQELLLASSAVFQIGHTECPTSALHNYLIIAETFTQFHSPELYRFQMRNRALEVLCPKLLKGSKAFYSHTSFKGRSVESDGTELLAMLWRLAGISDATDSRDKVYGMCGLLENILSDKDGLPKVDYNKSLAEILEDATRRLIVLTKSLWPLEIIAHLDRGPSDLPSWVPDLCDPATISMQWQPSVFRHVSTDIKLNIPDISKLKTKLDETMQRRGVSRPSIAEMDFPTDIEPGRLPVKAKYLADIVEVYTRMPMVSEILDRDLDRTACLSEWTTVAVGLDESQPSALIPTGGYLNTLQHLTPGLDYIRERHEARESDGSSQNEDKPRRIQPTDAYDGAVLFRTSCGLLGLCKGNVCSGDKVWQLAGGRYPFVLHRESLPKLPAWWNWSLWPREKVYNLVGIADLQGLESEHRKFVWSEKHNEKHFHDIVLV